MSRNRLYVNVELAPEEGDVFLAHVFRWHGELVQFSAHIDPAPTTSEFMILRKINTTAADWNVVVRQFDLQGLTDLCCNDVFQFRLGDQIVMEYLNTDNVQINLQVVLREVG